MFAPEDQLLTPEEVGKRWGISTQTLAHHRCAGKGMPYLKFGKLVRYRMSDLIEWERERLMEPAQK